MFIRCWGSRGSIPVSGVEFNRYGGDTTCMEVRSKNGHLIIIDAGSGIRNLGNAIIRQKKKNFHILFTHAHWDHILGLAFFKPLYFKDFHFTIYGSPLHLGGYKQVLQGLLRSPFFPVPFKQVEKHITFKDINYRPFSIDTISIYPIPLNHPNGGLGYKLVEDGKSFVFLTDNELDYNHPGGLSFDDYTEFAKNADLLIHDAEFTQKDYKKNRSWGHSLYSDAVKLGISADVKQVGLFHQNQERTDDQIDAIVADSKKQILKSHKKINALAIGTSFSIRL